MLQHPTTSGWAFQMWPWLIDLEAPPAQQLVGFAVDGGTQIFAVPRRWRLYAMAVMPHRRKRARCVTCCGSAVTGKPLRSARGGHVSVLDNHVRSHRPQYLNPLHTSLASDLYRRSRLARRQARARGGPDKRGASKP